MLTYLPNPYAISSWVIKVREYHGNDFPDVLGPWNKNFEFDGCCHTVVQKGGMNLQYR